MLSLHSDLLHWDANGYVPGKRAGLDLQGNYRKSQLSTYSL